MQFPLADEGTYKLDRIIETDKQILFLKEDCSKTDRKRKRERGRYKKKTEKKYKNQRERKEKKRKQNNTDRNSDLTETTQRLDM